LSLDIEVEQPHVFGCKLGNPRRAHPEDGHRRKHLSAARIAQQAESSLSFGERKTMIWQGNLAERTELEAAACALRVR
jgi:hypothetical protein